MFHSALSFNQDISAWRFSGAGCNLSSAFYGASAFNQDLSAWAANSFNNMLNAFYGVAGVDVSGWDMTACSEFRYAFQNAGSVVGPSTWTNCAPSFCSGMFRSTNFNEDLSNFDMAGCSNFEYMFRDDTSFDQSLAAWDISALVSGNNLFQGTGVGLSTANYSATLIAWAALATPPSNITFNGGDSMYSAGAAATAWSTLDTTYAWTITDGGLAA